MLYAGAKTEGKVTWYTSLAGNSYKELAAAFEAKYPGVRVEAYRGTRQELTARILAESQSKRYIFDTLESTIPLLKLLKDNKLILPYYFSAQAKYPDRVKENAPTRASTTGPSTGSRISVSLTTKTLFPAIWCRKIMKVCCGPS